MLSGIRRLGNWQKMSAYFNEEAVGAAILHITQPSLSRQIMQMEEELGVKLFSRSKHSIILTEKGRLLKRWAQEVVDLTGIY